jgi:NADPH:quinone reductase-like Zn-dependent oxidoreductase
MRLALSAISALSSSRATSSIATFAVSAGGRMASTSFSRTPMMRAAVAEGGACQVTSRPLPILKDGESLVRVHFSAINRADTLQRKGQYPPPPGESDVLGLELTGEVVEFAGSEIDGIALGSRVMALVAGGGNAEFCAVNTRHLLPIPATMDYRTAAAIPEVWLTAYQLLHIVGRLEPTDTVLIHAAGSGVGTAAVQLARLAGATVIAVAGDDDKLKIVSDLGAHHTINYK